MENYYVYIYLDPRKPGKYKYGNMEFDYEPFYVGKGKGNRCYSGIKSKSNSDIKANKIEKIIKSNKLPIVIKLIESLSNQEACRSEIETIKSIGRVCNSDGPLCNLTDGGTGGLGLKHPQEWKNKLSKPVIQFDTNKNIVKEYNSVKEASEKTGIIKQNISSALSGKYITSGGFIWEYKNESDKLQGHLKLPNKMPLHTEGTKSKMRNSAKKGEHHPMKNKIGKDHPKSKKVSQIDSNGNVVKVWNSLQDIKRELGFNPSNICRCCKGNVKRIGGFTWEYYNLPL